MASKRHKRRQQCGHKQRFATHVMANDAMHSLIRSGKKRGGWLHIYFCTFCHGYHFGHAPGGQQGGR
jgi:hypothetical protein